MSFSQLINFLTLPIITRLFTPDDYGVFTIAMTISTFFIIISTLNYDKAVILPKEENKSKKPFTDYRYQFVCFIVNQHCGSISRTTIQNAVIKREGFDGDSPNPSHMYYIFHGNLPSILLL